MSNVVIEADVSAKWSGFLSLGTSSWKTCHLQIIKSAGKILCQLKAINGVEKSFVLSGNIQKLSRRPAGCIISLQDRNQIVLRSLQQINDSLDKIVNTLQDIKDGKLKACGLMSARDKSSRMNFANITNSPRIHDKMRKPHDRMLTADSTRNVDRSNYNDKVFENPKSGIISSKAQINADRNNASRQEQQTRCETSTPPLKMKANHHRKALYSVDQNIHRDVSLSLNASTNRYGSLSTGSLSKLLNNKRKLTSDLRNLSELSTPKKFCNNPIKSSSDSKIFRKNLNLMWNNSVADDNCKTLEKKGFANVGKTCYMNAVLQVLLALHPFLYDLEDSRLQGLATEDFVMRILRTLAANRKNSKYVNESTILTNLKETIGNFNKYLKDYVQQDAHEFLSTCFDKIKEEVKEVQLSGDNVADVCPIALNFESLFIRQTSCNFCHKGAKFDESHLIINLQLPVLDSQATCCNPSAVSLQSLVKNVFEDEQVDCICDLCKQSCKTKWSYKWKKLPRILILHLKRYEYNKNSSMYKKRNDSVAISKYLCVDSLCDVDPNYDSVIKGYNQLNVMRENMAAMDQQQSVRRQLTLETELTLVTPNTDDPNSCEDDDRKSDQYLTNTVDKNEGQATENAPIAKFDYKYRLIGVISHKGQSISDGHYVCDVFDCQISKWVSYDDSFQESITEKDVIDKRMDIGCIFFYMAWATDS